MKVKLNPKKAKELNDKVRTLYKEYGAWPMATLDIMSGKQEVIYYEKDKLTLNEKIGRE